jgi:hypothetical protein
MIIVKLMGGLGNQMFQYAAARSLAWKHGTSLKMDLTFLESDQEGNTLRIFELDNFCISAGIASSWEIALLSGRSSTKLRSAAASILHKLAGFTLYGEKWFQFDPIVLRLPDNVYLEGYWQSERYFADNKEIIRKEFTLKTPLEGLNQNVAEEILAVNAVSLHVRRGDYVSDKKISEQHGVCDLEYYRRAIDRVVQTLKDPCFFVFSDDPEWVADNIKLRQPVRYISHNGSMAHEDLRLMSMCKHHVIANSSFSWWGAWLSTCHEKLVISPNKWFNSYNLNTKDLIPKAWIRL